MLHTKVIHSLATSFFGSRPLENILQAKYFRIQVLSNAALLFFRILPTISLYKAHLRKTNL